MSGYRGWNVLAHGFVSVRISPFERLLYGKTIGPVGVDKRPLPGSHTLASLTTPEEACMESINHAAMHHVPWNKG